MRGEKLGPQALKDLHKEIKTRAEAQSRQEALTKARAARPVPGSGAGRASAHGSHAVDAPLDDHEAFRRAVRAATPLRAAPRVVHAPAPPAAPAAHRRAAALGETVARADDGISDGGDVAPLLSEGGTAFVRHDAAADTARKLRRGAWPAGAELDLHGLRVEQARHAMLSFIDECLEFGIRCVRIVHGKGYGSAGLGPVLKDKVRTWLVQKPQVMAFSEAPEREGGAGALLVLLQRVEGGKR